MSLESSGRPYQNSWVGVLTYPLGWTLCAGRGTCARSAGKAKPFHLLLAWSQPGWHLHFRIQGIGRQALRGSFRPDMPHRTFHIGLSRPRYTPLKSVIPGIFTLRGDPQHSISLFLLSVFSKATPSTYGTRSLGC